MSSLFSPIRLADLELSNRIVVAPMYPEELQAVRRLCPDQTILVPEISPMSGGYAAAVRDGADSAGAGVIVSMARPVLGSASPFWIRIHTLLKPSAS